jgi:Ca2+-binding EF-hand superfamily protein
LIYLRADTAELRDALRAPDGGVPDAGAEEILEQIHAEKDGSVAWTEFAQAVASKRRGWSPR